MLKHAFDFHTHNQTSFGIIQVDEIDKFSPLPNHFYSIGIHPWYLNNIFDKIEFQLNKNGKQILAIGECGIDKLINTTVEKQIEYLIPQIELSEKYELPIILHIVKAFDEIIQLKKQLNPKQKWIIHGFNNYKQTKKLLDSDFYLSFGYSLLNNTNLQNEFITIPNNRFFLETDNKDVEIEKIYTFAAELKNISTQELKNIIEFNLKTVTNDRLVREI